MKHLKSYSIFEKVRHGRTMDHSTEEFGIVPVSPEEFPDELTNTQDTAVAYWEDHKQECGWTPEDRVRIPVDEVVYSTQGVVDMSVVDDMDDDEHSEGDIVIVDYQGRKWLLDGHHRMVRDRKMGRPSMAYVLDEDDVDFINRIVYGEGDEDY